MTEYVRKAREKKMNMCVEKTKRICETNSNKKRKLKGRLEHDSQMKKETVLLSVTKILLFRVAWEMLTYL